MVVSSPESIKNSVSAAVVIKNPSGIGRSMEFFMMDRLAAFEPTAGADWETIPCNGTVKGTCSRSDFGSIRLWASAKIESGSAVNSG